jgi:hypothetical protein
MIQYFAIVGCSVDDKGKIHPNQDDARKAVADALGSASVHYSGRHASSDKLFPDEGSARLKRNVMVAQHNKPFAVVEITLHINVQDCGSIGIKTETYPIESTGRVEVGVVGRDR